MMTGRIYLFGSLQLFPGDSEDEPPLEIRSTKLQKLLAYLSLHPHQLIHRDKLGAHLWPQAKQSSARRNLREYLYRARQLLDDFIPGADMIRTEDDFITFIPPPVCWIDVAEFERLTAEADQPLAPADIISRLQRATDLYRDELLTNFYDDWVVAARERLQEIFIDALARLGQALQADQRLSEAIAVTRRLLELDPLREEDHRRLMELYYASGDRARALQQYQLCCQFLEEELAAAPMPETQSLHQAILKESEPAPSFTPAPAPLPPERGQQPVRFVGRQAELARLTLALTESRAGQSQISLVTGESGLGKTRLVTEWLSSLPVDTMVLRGQGHEFEQDIPYRPVLDAIQQSLHLLPWDNLPPETSYAWLAPLAQLLPDLYYHLPDLSPAVPHPDSETGHHIMEGLAQLLLSLAREGPVILFLDDLHWADQPTWRFLPFLLRRARQVPVFVVATFSTSEASQSHQARLRRLEQQDLVRLLPLSRMWPDDIARMLSQLLDYPAKELAPLTQRLHQETQGNPFYAIETAKALAESGLRPPYGPEILDQLPLPSAVQTLIQNRLDRLCPESRQALATAAVIGRAFGFYLLAEVSQVDEDSLLNYLDDWLERGLIVEHPPGRYDFSHQRIREVAYNSLSRPRRRRIHYRLARALETSVPGDIERVAYHDSFSDQPTRAIPRLVEAGQRALNLRSYQQARNIGHSLLTILEQVPPMALPQDHLEYNLQLAMAYCFTGQMDQALPVLEKTAGLAKTLADAAQVSEVALRIAQVYWLQGNAPLARQNAERALALIEDTVNPVQKAAILRLLGRVNVAQGHFDPAVTQLRQSLSLEVGPENRLNRAAADGYLAIALAQVGQEAGAIAALEEAQQIAHQVGSLTALAIARVQGSVAYSALEMWSQAKRLATMGLNDCEAQDLPVYAFVARTILGRAAHYQGNDETAYRILKEAIRWAEANHYILFRHMAHLYLAESALARADSETVREQATIALALARRTGNCWTETRATDYLRQID